MVAGDRFPFSLAWVLKMCWRWSAQLEVCNPKLVLVCGNGGCRSWGPGDGCVHYPLRVELHKDSIMSMMKDLYDDGDDNMKKIIGEAMYKARCAGSDRQSIPCPLMSS